MGFLTCCFVFTQVPPSTLSHVVIEIVQQRSWCLHLNPLELISEFQQAKDASVPTLCTEREYAVWGKEIFLRAGDNMPSWMLWDHHKDVPGRPKSGGLIGTNWLMMNVRKPRQAGEGRQQSTAPCRVTRGEYRIANKIHVSGLSPVGWILPWITKHLFGEHQAYCPRGEGTQTFSFAVDEKLLVCTARLFAAVVDPGSKPRETPAK